MYLLSGILLKPVYSIAFFFICKGIFSIAYLKAALVILFLFFITYSKTSFWKLFEASFNIHPYPFWTKSSLSFINVSAVLKAWSRYFPFLREEIKQTAAALLNHIFLLFIHVKTFGRSSGNWNTNSPKGPAHKSSQRPHSLTYFSNQFSKTSKSDFSKSFLQLAAHWKAIVIGSFVLDDNKTSHNLKISFFSLFFISLQYFEANFLTIGVLTPYGSLGLKPSL